MYSACACVDFYISQCFQTETFALLWYIYRFEILLLSFIFSLYLFFYWLDSTDTCSFRLLSSLNDRFSFHILENLRFQIQKAVQKQPTMGYVLHICLKTNIINNGLVMTGCRKIVGKNYRDIGKL